MITLKSKIVISHELRTVVITREHILNAARIRLSENNFTPNDLTTTDVRHKAMEVYKHWAKKGYSLIFNDDVNFLQQEKTNYLLIFNRA